MNISLIGGAGFIGRSLSRLLAREHNIKIIDLRPNDEFSEQSSIGDCRNRELLRNELAGSDLVVLLAAQHADNVRPRSLYYSVNVDGAEAVAATCSDLGISRMLFASSVAVYGPSRTPASESTAPAPVNDYGRSKLAAEQVLRKWAAADSSRSLTIVRPSVVFGPTNRGNVYNLFAQLASKHFIMVGNGSTLKSMAYVENVAEFIEFLVARLKPGVEVFNYCDQPDLSTNELVTLVRKSLDLPQLTRKIPYWAALSAATLLDILGAVSGKKFRISSTRIRKFCTNTRFSAQKAFASGFHPRFALHDAIVHTVRSEFRAHSNQPGVSQSLPMQRAAG